MKKHLIGLTLSLASTMMTLSAQATEKLFIPSHPVPKAPLFVALHGCLSDAALSEKSTRMSEFAEKHGFYVFYPEPSLGEEESKGCFNFYTEESQRPGGGDAAVIVSRIQELIRQHDIDERKVFVIGMSGGASLISVLTSCYPQVFAGAAIHSGMGYGLAGTWQESLLIAGAGPIPLRPRNTTCSPSDFKGKLFLIHGSRDQVMNPQHFEANKKDYLSDTTSTSKIVGAADYRFPYVHQNYFRGEQQVAQSIYVLGMNHEWSGSDPINPIGPRGPDVSPMIVDFFLND
jgi:poly(hydroxyalkanoate) depolymerase family esterase